MPLSWNEIRSRAHAFAREWAAAESENAQAKPFWIEFFNVFGISSKRVASFEEPVRKLGDKQGFIDLLWKGTLLVEHKSRGKDLDKAYIQALDYFPGLKERDLPKYVIVSDFARIRIYDLEAGTREEFELREFPKHIRLFGFIAGYQTRHFGQEDPVNTKAAEHLGRLHDQLKASGYDGHALEVFLVRVLFCLFAEDTAIYEKRQFQDYLETRTAPDGSDLGMHLAQLWQVLDTPHDKRQKSLDEQLAVFPYVNGQLFSEQLPIAAFDAAMRETLLDCCALDWSRISPAVFGSLFQSIMDARARRAIGAHYTSETNILRLIRPLFLDALWAEFHKVKHNRNKLFEFLKKLAGLRFFDPACGCGNFLVIAYRELRLLELEVLRQVRDMDKSGGQMHLDIFQLVQTNVDQFYGIEIDEWPARIAEVALWLTDHQMNMRVSEEFGDYYVRLPLKHAPRIVHGNALRLDWNDVIPAARLDYLLGNPPFIGKQHQTIEQKDEQATIFHDLKGAGILDYVACWYRKAAEYMQPNPRIRAAFVSTNSITQGEQVGVLWPDLFARGVKIHFAHRTFQWNSEARGKAAVHCVIIGFGLGDVADKTIYEYEDIKGEPHAVKAANINPYLVDAPDVALQHRRTPISHVPLISFGSMPNDGGHLLLSDEEKNALLMADPDAAPWILPLLGADEFINKLRRWCLWLINCPPNILRNLPEVSKRVAAVKAHRLASNRATTKELAATPALFGEIRQPSGNYVLIPRHSSERRLFIPMGFLTPDVICGDANMCVPDATLYHFGVLTSAMHMAWVRAVCGRLKSDYRYSAGIVYNNFPWPDAPTDAQREKIEAAAQAVLNAREQFPEATLADLYDPLTMPPALLKAHQKLDAAVDAAYGKKSFKNDAERVAFLFERYQTLTSLLPGEKPKRNTKKQVK